jgi:hypothetical protein
MLIGALRYVGRAMPYARHSKGLGRWRVSDNGYYGKSRPAAALRGAPLGQRVRPSIIEGGGSLSPAPVPRSLDIIFLGGKATWSRCCGVKVSGRDRGGGYLEGKYFLGCGICTAQDGADAVVRRFERVTLSGRSA